MKDWTALKMPPETDTVITGDHYVITEDLYGKKIIWTQDKELALQVEKLPKMVEHLQKVEEHLQKRLKRLERKKELGLVETAELMELHELLGGGDWAKG